MCKAMRSFYSNRHNPYLFEREDHTNLGTPLLPAMIVSGRKWLFTDLSSVSPGLMGRPVLL